MKQKPLILLLAAVALLSGCSSSYVAPEVYEFPDTRTYEIPREQAWNQFIEFISRSFIPIERVDHEGGFFVSGLFNVQSYSHCDCGGQKGYTGGEDARDRRFFFRPTSMRIRVLITDAGEGRSRALVATQFFHSFNTDVSIHRGTTPFGQCNSTGEFEAAVMDAIGGVTK